MRGPDSHVAPAAPGAAETYRQRLSARRAAAATLSRREQQIGNARLAVFVAALVLAWFCLRGVLSAAWLAVPAAVFCALVLHHAQVIPRRRRADRAVAFYEDGVARLEDRWVGRGPAGDAFLDPDHPYARDLDVFGDGSLFQLICRARTPLGEHTLASWLCAPAPPDTVVARQRAVAELRERLDLREELALTGEAVGAALHPDALATWAARPRSLGGRGLRAAAAAAVALSAVTWAAWYGGLLGPLPLAAALTLQSCLGGALRKRVRAAQRAVELPGRDLALLAQILARFESEPCEAARLRQLQAELQSGGAPPSQRVAQLGRLIALLDARRNQFFAPIAPLLLWSTQLCMAIEAWRAVSGAAVPRWIAAVGELEALSAIAGYAYENPESVFPQLAAEKPLFAARELGHPLLPRERVVRNDVRLDGENALLVVSGSNMSGKSTLLRSIGCNAVLAQMGAPVRAAQLRLSALTVATSMRVDDSLREGTSRFYAEIKRLRQVVELALAAPPALFLLDEVLHGTNSQDRRIGAEAVVRTLLERGAVGLITTHDLTLAQIADNLAPRARNVHFADHLENGEMVFDYRMHDGVVRKSNALELMRSVGLIEA